MTDLTIIYVTANTVPESWQEFQLHHLLEAAGDMPIISISRKPMDLGSNIVESRPRSYYNIYMSLLDGALAATTPYVAMAEDDTLYTHTHFVEFRPPENFVAYDRSRWSLFVWEKEPFFCLRQRISNCSLIAPRELVIEALEERKAKYPQGIPDTHCGEIGRRDLEDRLHMKRRNCCEWWSFGPIVQLNHPTGSDETQRAQWKKHGQIRAYDIPYWGKASEIVAHYG
ncbi:hypothetical protein EH220_02950 [bacterium]|nr:MAG: hypothetical protein EH220_02950 [bacterium]